MTVSQYPESWQDKVAWAQAKREASLAKVKPKLVGVPEVQSLPQYSRDLPKDILTSREIELTDNYKITELLRLLRERDVSVEEVTKAFLRRAALAHAAVRTKIPLSVESCTLISVDQLSHRASLGSGHRAG
jgi:amidase